MDQEYLWNLDEGDFWHKNKDRVLIKLVKKGSVLDVAAGTGTFSIKLAKLGFDVTYIDLSNKYLKLARKRAKGLNIKFIEGDFFKHKFGKKYDNIVISGFIEHIEDDLGLLKIIYTLLNPGGRVVLLTSAYQFLYSNFDRSVGHYRRYSRRELEHKIKLAGFKIKFLKHWDILGIPMLLWTKITGRIPIETEKLNNKFLNYILDKWFLLFENHCLIPSGLDLIAMAEKPTDTF